MKNPLVSVIVPVFNAERFILNMILQLKAQTYPNKEIIFIDDGSTDSSLNLLRSNIKELDKASVFSFPNGGAASARNHGLEMCHGDIICFLDCDDEISKDYVETLVVPLINDENVGISVCGYKKVFLDGKVSSFPLTSKNRLVSNKTAIEYVFSKHHTNMIVPWAKAIRKRVFTSFFPQVRCEDEALLYRLFLNCEKVFFLSNVLYTYIEQEYSDSKNDDISKIFDICSIYYDRYAILNKKRICVKDAFFEYAFTYFGFVHRLKGSEKEELVKIHHSRTKLPTKLLFSFKIFRYLGLYIRYRFDIQNRRNS